MLNYEEGRYRVRVTAAALGEALSGNAQVELVIEVLGKYEGMDFQPYNAEVNPSRRVFLTLTEETLGKTSEPGWVAQSMADLGFVGLGFGDEHLQVMVGQVRDAQCAHDEFEGKAREKWQLWRKLKKEPLHPAQAGTAKRLNMKFADVLKSMR